uniref:Methyl-accepting chemotaxis protein n=1 Tax=Aeromonas caviae TaxID=648 RepID=A0A2D2CLR8_AERCA|nr:methyl-accepting chemotaxis protein [Aeromonas caviae]
MGDADRLFHGARQLLGDPARAGHLLASGTGLLVRQIHLALGAVGGARHLGGTHLQLGDGGGDLIGLALLILHPGHGPFTDLGGAARLVHQVAGASIDLGEQLPGLVRQGVDGAGQAAELAAALIVDAPGHVARGHAVKLPIDELQRALDAARRGIADEEGGGGRDGGHDQDPDAGTADRVIGPDPALAGDAARRFAHLVQQRQAVDQAGVELLVQGLQRGGELLAVTHGGQQPLRAERQLLHPVQVDDEALSHIVGHLYPLEPLARHLDVLAEHLLQLVEVGLGIGTTDVLQIPGDAGGDELGLVAHGSLAGGLLQQQVGGPLIGVLQPDERQLQLMAPIEGGDPLAMLGQHLIRQPVELTGCPVDLAEPLTRLGHAVETGHRLALGQEALLLRLELAGQLGQLGGILAGPVGQHPAVAVLQRTLEPGDRDHQGGGAIRYLGQSLVDPPDLQDTNEAEQHQKQQHQHKSGDDPLHDR